MYNSDYTTLVTQTQPLSSNYHLAVGNTSYDPYGCSPPPTDLVTVNSTLVVLRGNCTFTEKALLAQEAMAAMLIVVYDSESVSSPQLNSSVTIPVLMVDNETGQLILVSVCRPKLINYHYG